MKTMLLMKTVHEEENESCCMTLCEWEATTTRGERHLCAQCAEAFDAGVLYAQEDPERTVSQHTPGPYSIPQVLANLKEMARTDDLQWIGQVANDIVQRGIEPNADLLLALRNLTDAATLIEERWDRGDLADAVRSLMVDRDNARDAIQKAGGAK